MLTTTLKTSSPHYLSISQKVIQKTVENQGETSLKIRSMTALYIL